MEFWIDAGIGKQLRLESGWLVERPHARSERALSATNDVISNNKRMSHCRSLLNGGKTQIDARQIFTPFQMEMCQSQVYRIDLESRRGVKASTGSNPVVSAIF